MSHLQITILSSHQWFTASFILPNVQPLISSRMWIPAKPKTFSQPNGVHGFIEFCTTMCRNNAVCVMKGPVRTNVGMSSQTIFISTLSLILNSDKDRRSHKDFISSDDLFSELLIDSCLDSLCQSETHTWLQSETIMWPHWPSVKRLNCPGRESELCENISR